MENTLLRRMEDLARRCDRSNVLTHSHFLVPAEQAQVLTWHRQGGLPPLVLHGGHEDCERKVAFFLPDYLSPADFDPCEELSALALQASFGTPGHRDYLGALLGLGVQREFVGDLWVKDDTAWVFCLPSVAGRLAELTQAGRITVRARPVAPEQVPSVLRDGTQVRFTLASPRFDAALGSLFRLSRTAAARLIAAGAASLNGLPCLKADAPVAEGDVLSLRGYGKGRLLELGGSSRKGRIFVTALRY